MNHIYSKNNLTSRGNSLVGIIITLVIVGLIVGGAYYYFSRQIPDISRDTEEPIADPEPKTEIAFIYRNATEIPIPSEAKEMLLAFYPEAQMASYVSADSPEEVEEWYYTELKAEGWQEVEGIFSEWEKDGNLLGVEVGALTEEEIDEMGVEGARTYIFLYRDRLPEPEPEPEPESDPGSTPGPKDFSVSLFTEKEIYKIEEPFNLTLNVDYDGEPFKAAIVYDSYRKGFSKHFYKGYIENISSKDINRSKFHAGYPEEKAFRIHDRGHSYPLNFFLDEGTYIISVYIYDCEKIAEEGYGCNPSHVFPSTFGIFDDTPEDLIKHNVRPLASAEKEIIVKGGSVECVSDSDCADRECVNCVLGHYRCIDTFSKPKCIECKGEIIVNGKRTMCREGYTCKNHECVEDPLYCQDDEDCGACEGCQDNKQFCNNMNQCQDCHWSRRSCQEGYICEDWGCTSIEVLDKIDDCKPTMEICGVSDKRNNPEIRCYISSDPNKNLKCLECRSDLSCKEGYHCYNYECIAG